MQDSICSTTKDNADMVWLLWTHTRWLNKMEVLPFTCLTHRRAYLSVLTVVDLPLLLFSMGKCIFSSFRVLKSSFCVFALADCSLLQSVHETNPRASEKKGLANAGTLLSGGINWLRNDDGSDWHWGESTWVRCGCGGIKEPFPRTAEAQLLWWRAKRWNGQKCGWLFKFWGFTWLINNHTSYKLAYRPSWLRVELGTVYVFKVYTYLQPLVDGLSCSELTRLKALELLGGEVLWELEL